jgi:hypothetical protein
MQREPQAAELIDVQAGQWMPRASGLRLRAGWRLTPSLSDLFFAFFITWIFVVNPLGGNFVLQDADTALHTRIGQYILANRAVPAHDLFSFSMPGGTWYAFEWLAETAFGWMFNAMGLKGIVLLAGVLIALYLTLLLKYMLWRGANGLVAMVVMMLAVNASSVHFHARPHLFTLLFLAIGIWILENNRRHGGALIWALVPLAAVWANTHGGFVMFFALLALRIAGCLAESRLWPEDGVRRRREAIQLSAVGAACVVASFANPYGIRLHAHIVHILSSPWLISNVSEFMSPSFRSEPLYEFMVLLFAGLACVAALVRKRAIVEPLWIVFLAYCSLTSARHIPIYILVAAPILAGELSEWWAAVTALCPRRSIAGICRDVSETFSARLAGTSLLIPAVIAAFALLPGISWPRSFPDGDVPVKLIERNLDRLANGRLFTADQTADYLIFRNQPRQKVFLDSRHNYYGKKLVEDYLAIAQGGPKWRMLLDYYRLNLVLCSTSEPIASLVQAAGGWRVVDRDGKHVLYEREKKG